jgi:hypothetical protein
MKSPVASRPTQCPFCKTPGYAVEYRGPKGAAEKGMEQAEEQRVIMATLRMRQEEQAKAVSTPRLEEKASLWKPHRKIVEGRTCFRCTASSEVRGKFCDAADWYGDA